jgi:hypothetical protein
VPRSRFTRSGLSHDSDPVSMVSLNHRLTGTLRKTGLYVLAPKIANVIGQAVKAVAKFGPDPPVFLCFALIFAVTVSEIKSSLTVLFTFIFIILAYFIRMERAQTHKINLANRMLDIELKKLRESKMIHQGKLALDQPSLPLDYVSKPNRKKPQ